MRRPLDRRMFTTPQQRRGMARMPQGILASGPRIMNAAMQQQEPVRMQDGGSVSTRSGLTGMSGFKNFLNEYILGSRAQLDIGGSPSTDESVAPPPAPGPGTGSSSSAVVPPVVSAVPPQNSPQGGPPIIGAEDNTDVVGAEDAPTSTAPDTNLTEQFDDLVESRRPSLPKQEGPKNIFEELQQMLESTTPEGKKKKTSEYVDDAKKLLADYGIEAPDLKSRRDLRIMEFFLNMAAGQSPDFLTNVAQAGKESFKGYGEDVREIEAAEQKLKLAGLEMGLAEEARAEASEQALLLKKYDIAADLFEKINDLPDKSQQIQVLMESYGVPQADAIKMVYPGKTVTPQGYELRLKGFLDSGHSPTVAHYLAAGGATLLSSLAEGNPIGEQIAAVATASGQPLTVADVGILGVETTSVGD